MTTHRRIVLVTGTDTGVGKTRVARAIVRSLCLGHRAVAPLKLVETGCALEPDGLRPDDGIALADAAGLRDRLDCIAPERFALAASPALAASYVGRTLRFDELTAHVRRAAELAPDVLLEGAGGVLVPLGPEGTFADLAQQLGARVVLVARDALGTINHTLLTVEALARRALPLLAIVLQPVGPQPSPLDHAAQLRQLIPGIPMIGPLPWDPSATDDTLARQLVAAGLDPVTLFDR